MILTPDDAKWPVIKPSDIWCGSSFTRDGFLHRYKDNNFVAKYPVVTQCLKKRRKSLCEIIRGLAGKPEV